MRQTTLVSIGLPVRNGAEFLDEAICLLRNQTHANLEIIVSDNASEDGSLDIIQRHADEDPRIKVYRQDATLTALANFRFVFEQAHGDYFMWAACDDRRSLDYVEQLLSSLKRRPEAVLSFGEVAAVNNLSQWQNMSAFHFAFETSPYDTVPARLRRYTRINCLHIYGLIRSTALSSYPWFEIDNGPDMPLLVHLACLGDFIKADGGCFYYYAPPAPKTLEERALANSLQRLQRYPELRLSWACAKAANHATQLAGRSISKLRAFLIVYTNRHWRWIRSRLFRAAPAFVIAAYRRWFKRHYSCS